MKCACIIFISFILIQNSLPFFLVRKVNHFQCFVEDEALLFTQKQRGKEKCGVLRREVTRVSE